MGCAAFTFLGIYVAAANKTNTWIVGESGAVGAILFFVASYRAWKRQSDAKTDVAAKLMAATRKPDLQGTFYDVSIRQFPYQDQSKSGAWIDFKIYVCNQSQAETTIRETVITASELSGQSHRFTKNVELHPLSPFWKDVLSYGLGQRFIAQAGLDGIGFNMIDPATVRVSVIDAFGVEHPLSRAASAEAP
jgi:hypothetical protein